MAELSGVGHNAVLGTLSLGVQLSYEVSVMTSPAFCFLLSNALEERRRFCFYCCEKKKSPKISDLITV